MMSYFHALRLCVALRGQRNRKTVLSASLSLASQQRAAVKPVMEIGLESQRTNRQAISADNIATAVIGGVIMRDSE